jgi:hypothetical protein
MANVMKNSFGRGKNETNIREFLGNAEIAQFGDAAWNMIATELPAAPPGPA